MAITQLDRLVDEQNRTWQRMLDIQAGAEKDARDWTAEERTNWDAANDRLTVLDGDIQRHADMAKRQEVDFRNSAGLGQAAGGPADVPESREVKEERENREYESAFKAYMRGGLDGCTTEQRQSMIRSRENRAYQSVGTPAEGGYLVPPGYRTTMTETLKAFGGLLNLANVIQTSTGQPLQWPTNDDTGNVGAILTENTVITEQNTTIGTKSLGAYVYTSKLVRVSLQLLQDSAFDLDTWLPRKLGQRIGRAVATDLVNGTGVAQPTGLLPGATSGTPTALSAANFISGGGGASAHLGYDAIINLEHSVDPAYRQLGRSRFLMSDQALKIIRKYKDTQGRPLYLPVPVPGEPATINGVPFTVDQAMPAGTTGVGDFVATNRPILFGDFYEGFIVRQALDVQAVRLAERYADFLQVGFFGFMRIDATPDDTAAVKALVLS